MSYKPPFTITEKIVNLVAEIMELVTRITINEVKGINPKLRVELLMKIIGNSPKSGKELMELAGLKHRPTFRKNYLLPALELGLVEMTIPDKPNSSKQRYIKA